MRATDCTSLPQPLTNPPVREPEQRTVEILVRVSLDFGRPPSVHGLHERSHDASTSGAENRRRNAPRRSGHRLSHGLRGRAQEPILFSRSLQHNIGFGVDEPDERLIDWAADIAHLKQEVETFPEKFETMIGERGVTLSGGQRQRTSISRAIARHPEILILDDVLSAVDTQTEAAIMEKLQPVMKERTTLFVSHRVSTLRYADEIVVIEEGRITQRGSHDELVAQGGYYCELNHMQQIEEQLEGDS